MNKKLFGTIAGAGLIAAGAITGGMIAFIECPIDLFK